MCSMKKSDQPIEVIGPIGLEKYIKTVMEISSTYLSYPIKITELSPNESHDLGWRSDIKGKKNYYNFTLLEFLR